MKKTDKFLVGIVIGIILLVVVAFGVAFSRPEPTYQPENTPGGVAQNYLMALHQEEYDRAYGYLSPDLPGYPETLDDFIDNVHQNKYQFHLNDREVSLDVISVREGIKNFSVVTVRETRFEPGSLFESGEYTREFDFDLRQTSPSNEWKIVDGDSYWSWCWGEANRCK